MSSMYSLVASSRSALPLMVSSLPSFLEAFFSTALNTLSEYAGKSWNSLVSLAISSARPRWARHSVSMNGLAASMPSATVDSVGAG